MRKLILVLGFLMFSVGIYANEMGPGSMSLLNSSKGDTLLVTGTSTVYSLAFSVQDSEHFGIAYKVIGSAPSVTLQVEESWMLPPTEGSSDSNWTVPSEIPTIATSFSTNNTWTLQSLSPVVAPFARIKIVGTGGNSASQMSLKILKK